MIVNVWLGIPEDDHNELNNRRGTENNIGPAKAFVDGQLDPEVVQRLYKTRTQGANTLHLWSVILDDADSPLDQQINAFRQEFPGARVEGVWKPDGFQLGTEPEYGTVLVDVEIQDPAWDEALWPQIDNPNYQEDPWNGEPATINDPAFTPPTITVQEERTVIVGSLGTPNYEMSDQLINYMPDQLDEDGNVIGPATAVTDVNLPMGWSNRRFS